MGELPPDPLPDMGKAHTVALFEPCPLGLIHVACLDCDGEVIGHAGCEHEALRLIGEHAERMGTT